MVEAVINGLLPLLTWSGFMLLLLGTLMGMLFGILPGLGGPQVLALLVPITYGLDSQMATIVLVAAMGAVPFSGSITAILINTPGTGASAATTFDGFPLSQQGKAGLALGASATASALGAIFGAIVLAFLIPVGREVVMAFSYPEFFMMAIMGLSVIALVSQGSPWKCLISGGFGLLLSTIGSDPITGAGRFTFGNFYLWDGIKPVPALIGMFAIAESVELFIKKISIAGQHDISISGVWDGVKSVFQHFGVFIRGSIVGTIIGIIPGVGGVVANFLAYAQAVQTAKDKSKFGQGDIRGVIAAEAANNAKDGGALVPTVVFGIPGSLEMAVLLGALILHGLEPGPDLLINRLDVIFTLIFTLVLANVLVSSLGLASAGQLAKLTKIPSSYIAPVIFCLSLIGAYSMNNLFGDVLVTLCFGFLGYFVKRLGYSRIALIIALLLGKIAQESFHQTLVSMGVKGFFLRPISLSLFSIILIFLTLPYLKTLRKNSRKGMVE